MDYKEFSEGTGSLKPGWMLKKDPELAKKLKDQQDRKKYVPAAPTKKEDMEESMSNDDKSSIALRALVAKKNLKQSDGKVKSIDFLKKMKDRVAAGNNMKEENMPQSFKGFLVSLTELTDKQKKHIDKNNNGKIDGHDFKLLRKEDDMDEGMYSSDVERAFPNGKASGVKTHAPVAPVPDKKYIKGTPENLALKASRKPINGMPTGKMKEETELDELSKSTLGSYAKKASRDAVITRKIGADFERKADAARSPGMKAASNELSSRYKQKSFKRRDGLEKAVDRLSKEEFELDEESHQSKTTMKHIPNASPALKKAAKDIKPGVAGYRDRIAMLKAGNVKEEVELDEGNKESKKEFLARQERLAAAGAETAKDPARLKKMSSIPGYSAAMNLAKKTTKEEVDQIEERNKENAMKRKVMDASRGARYKLNNPVPDAEPEHKTAQAHNKAIGRALRNEAKDEDPPFDGPYKKVTGDGNVKDKSGAVHTPMSRARDLARKAMQQKMKEDFNLEITEEQAAELCDTASLTEKVSIKEKTHEQDTMKSYKDFVTEIKMSDLPSRTVKGTSYGAQYHDPEGDDHADDRKPKASKPTDATKRGRGRPSGSKSGAKQQGSEKSSNYGGIDRTTYALRLPNNNK